MTKNIIGSQHSKRKSKFAGLPGFKKLVSKDTYLHIRKYKTEVK